MTSLSVSLSQALAAMRLVQTFPGAEPLRDTDTLEGRALVSRERLRAVFTSL